MPGSALVAVIRPRRRSATECVNGLAMTMVMADARSTALPAKGPVRRSAPICGPFEGSHKHDLHLDVATDEAMLHAKRATPHLIQRRCIGDLEAHIGYT
jgi:hypothetical protein